MKKSYLIPLLILLCLSICYTAPAQTKESKRSAKRIKKENRQSLAKFNKLYNYLNNNYIETIDGEELVGISIKEMLEHLDPFSRYVDAQTAIQLSGSSTGQTIGVGIQTRIVNDTIRIEALTKGAPAERAGMIVDDQIVAIDGQSVVGLYAQQISEMIRGKVGTDILFSVIRKGSPAPLKFIVTREIIIITTIDSSYIISEGVGYIKINRFARKMFVEFNSAYKSLGSPKSLILDLRDNTGGFLDEALRLSTFFLPAKSLILSIREGNNSTPKEVRIKHSTNNLDVRTVVLINEYSASASELIAGTLQDWDRAVVVGRRSYGKGLMQHLLEFKDGSLAQIVHAEDILPSGRAIQRPYKRGESIEFRESLNNRAKQDHADSIAGDDSLLYHTLKLGRKVYGGGGIYPDFHVILEPTIDIPYIYTLLQNDIFNLFSSDYLRENRGRLLELYPDMDSFITGFDVDQDMVEQLVIYATESEIGVSAEEMVESQEQIKQQIMEHIIYKLWGEDGRQRWLNRDDRDVRRALELFENWENQSPIATTLPLPH